MGSGNYQHFESSLIEQITDTQIQVEKANTNIIELSNVAFKNSSKNLQNFDQIFATGDIKLEKMLLELFFERGLREV